MALVWTDQCFGGRIELITWLNFLCETLFFCKKVSIYFIWSIFILKPLVNVLNNNTQISSIPDPTAKARHTAWEL